MVAGDFIDRKFARHELGPAAAGVPGVARRPFSGLEKNQAADIWSRPVRAYREVDDLIGVLRETAVETNLAFISDLQRRSPDFSMQLLHLFRDVSRHIFRF